MKFYSISNISAQHVPPALISVTQRISQPPGQDQTRDNVVLDPRPQLFNHLNNLLWNFMRKIKKFWSEVQNINLKKSILSPNLTFWPPSGLGKSFPEGNIYIVGSVLLVFNFMQKIKKMCHALQKIYLKKSILGPKFDLLTPGGPGKKFSWG